MDRAQCKNHKMHCKTSKVSNLFGMPGETSPVKNQQTVLAPLKIIQYIHKILRADQTYMTMCGRTTVIPCKICGWMPSNINYIIRGWLQYLRPRGSDTFWPSSILSIIQSFSNYFLHLIISLEFYSGNSSMKQAKSVSGELFEDLIIP